MPPLKTVFASEVAALPVIAVIAVIAVFGFSSWKTAAAEDSLSAPYVVYVAHDELFTRCGPSEEYYRTDPLKHGQELEVYVETEDGWLGVRPPDNSFCWVPASTVDLSGSKETGKILEDRTVAWIGTHLGRARKYRWQVQLAEGEEVTVIGRSERDGPDGPQLWYRIVPPSGEFRWVHRDQTVESSEELVASLRRQQEAEAKADDIEFIPVERKELQDNGQLELASADGGNRMPEAVPQTRNANGPLSKNRNSSSRRTIRSPDQATTGIAPFQSPGPRTTPQPVAANEIPSFRSAPGRAPMNESVAQSSVEAIGSGLRQDWQASAAIGASEEPSEPTMVSDPRLQTASANERPSTSIANAAIIGNPRLVDIGSNLDASAPDAGEAAGDGNWVGGGTRETTVAQVSGIRPMPAQTLVPSSRNSPPQFAPAPVPAAVTVISREAIAKIESEVRGADAERLQLVLSRLMAERASSAETRPLIDRAYEIAESTSDPVAAGRARLVGERAEQYQRVAQRRDGPSSSVRNGTLVVPRVGINETIQTQTSGAASPAGDTGAPVDSFAETGFLVQVYSARSNSPPYALTDHGGHTVAYVTPSPGINLRTHLNSRISVSGRQGFLQGLNTPHIVVTKAVRARD